MNNWLICIELFLCINILPIVCIAFKLPAFCLNYSSHLQFLCLLSALTPGANCLPIVLSFIISTPRVPISGMPTNASTLPGTTKTYAAFFFLYALRFNDKFLAA